MRFVLALAVLSAAAAPALADSYTHQGLVEPVLHLAGPHQTPTVALTFDACMGRTDPRILGELVDKKIPATIFVTARWLKYNQASFAVLRAHPDLFEIEDHGENHIPAVDRPISIYGIKAAGSAEAIGREVEGGAAAITKAGAPQPKWYRDATAVYSPSAITEIKALGYRVAGFSVNGDGGSLLGASASAAASARPRTATSSSPTSTSRRMPPARAWSRASRRCAQRAFASCGWRMSRRMTRRR
jgi:peptidoglycan/xylan/chitin deacetylase (PgdA/CDA1 family)